MKNHIAILIGALALCSCEDYLTQENPNKIESEYYFTDESSLEIYTNGFIRSFATAIKSFVDGDKNADTHSWDGQAAYFMDNYSADDATNWTTSNWSQLRSINYYLDNMRNAVASDAILDHYEGVGRFFRALFYIDKVQTFGAVPWYDTSIDATDQEALFKDRDNREFVASKILEDLDYACTYCLTSDKYRVRASYIHRYVALALKARFCLYEGTMRKYHAVDPSTGRAWTKDESRFYLGECVKACEAIMGDGVYKLTDDPAKRQTQYRDMFTNADACGVYTDEFIWARDYDIDLKVTYAINNYMVNPQHANYAFTRQFIDTYLMTDGTPFTSKYPDYDDLDLVAECTDRDYRLAQTIRTPGFTRDGGTTQWAPDVKFSKTGYQPIKWLTDDSSKDTNVAAIASDVPLIRYAEVLLAYAEAKAELGEMSEEVWDKTIKPLRERAGVDGTRPTKIDEYLQNAYYSTDDGNPKITDCDILEIRRERAIELLLEGRRYDDLMRWHLGGLLNKQWYGIYIGEVDKAYDLNNDGVNDVCVTDKAGSEPGVKYIVRNSERALEDGASGRLVYNLQRYFNEQRYVHPIPKTALDKNPDLGQNVAWK